MSKMSPNNYKNVTNDLYKYDQLSRQNQPNKGENITNVKNITNSEENKIMVFFNNKKVSKL